MLAERIESIGLSIKSTVYFDVVGSKVCFNQSGDGRDALMEFISIFICWLFEMFRILLNLLIYYSFIVQRGN